MTEPSGRRRTCRDCGAYLGPFGDYTVYDQATGRSMSGYCPPCGRKRASGNARPPLPPPNPLLGAVLCGCASENAHDFRDCPASAPANDTPERRMTTFDAEDPSLIPVGTRVRHWNHQYTAAYLHGTGTVVGYAEARDGTPEYMVEHDEPILPGDSPLRQWPLDATIAVKTATS